MVGQWLERQRSRLVRGNRFGSAKLKLLPVGLFVRAHRGEHLGGLAHLPPAQTKCEVRLSLAHPPEQRPGPCQVESIASTTPYRSTEKTAWASYRIDLLMDQVKLTFDLKFPVPENVGPIRSESQTGTNALVPTDHYDSTYHESELGKASGITRQEQ